MGWNLCKYKNIFGEENTGFHSYRFMNVAIFDLIGTFLIALAISYFTRLNIFIIFMILIILSLIAHNAFCVKTTFTKFFHF